jgi:hypothetical protein
LNGIIEKTKNSSQNDNSSNLKKYLNKINQKIRKQKLEKIIKI